MGAGVVQGSGGSGRGGRRRRGRSAAMADINITPFVDVMLVLMIIFMVAAPMLTVGVPIEMPETAAQALPTEQEPPLALTITADGQISIQETPVVDGELIPKLRAIAAERENDKVYLRADASVPYERVAQVMGALNLAGFNSIGLVTDTDGPAFGATAVDANGG